MKTPTRRLKYSGLDQVGHLWEANNRRDNGGGGKQKGRVQGGTEGYGWRGEGISSRGVQKIQLV